MYNMSTHASICHTTRNVYTKVCTNVQANANLDYQPDGGTNVSATENNVIIPNNSFVRYQWLVK